MSVKNDNNFECEITTFDNSLIKGFFFCRKHVFLCES